MQAGRYQLLAGSPFAYDQNRLGQGSRAGHMLQHFQEQRRLANDRLWLRIS
jgi:hypothetical protein